MQPQIKNSDHRQQMIEYVCLNLREGDQADFAKKREYLHRNAMVSGRCSPDHDIMMLLMNILARPEVSIYICAKDLEVGRNDWG